MDPEKVPHNLQAVFAFHIWKPRNPETQWYFGASCYDTEAPTPGLGRLISPWI